VVCSTGAQSFPEQHSLGYQECAPAGPDQRPTAATNDRMVEIEAFNCRSRKGLR
jgi:hypothetical protein